MRIAMLLAIFLVTNESAVAGVISVTSPDRARTFAYGEMVWHQLYSARAGGELAARITFSNFPYVGDKEPRQDDPFDFRFPGVRLDAARRVFFARGSRGERVPVARFRGDPACSWIDLLPGAKIHLLKKSGRVTALLTATDFPRGGLQWVEMDDNFSLQNLLIGLLGEPHLPRE